MFEKILKICFNKCVKEQIRINYRFWWSNTVIWNLLTQFIIFAGFRDSSIFTKLIKMAIGWVVGIEEMSDIVHIQINSNFFIFFFMVFDWLYHFLQDIYWRFRWLVCVLRLKPVTKNDVINIFLRVGVGGTKQQVVKWVQVI